MDHEIIFKEEAFAIQGALFSVYREMGCGFLEAVYHECLVNELNTRNIPYESRRELVLYYKDVELKQRYIPDFICYGKIIIELKAVKALMDEHKAQVFNYLRVTGFKLSLLANFGHFPKMEIQRIVL
jgi:GxxExxY protein